MTTPAPKHLTDRTGLTLMDKIQREKVKENFAKLADPYVMNKMEGVSDISIKDLMMILAQHGGRVEVRGLGSFHVHEVPAKEKIVGGALIKRPAKRVLIFRQSQMMRDMLNEDALGQEEPLPNSDYFIDRRNLLV